MNQSYIKIFKNVSGDVTIRYGALDDCMEQSVDIETSAFKMSDVECIAHKLLEILELEG